MVLGVEDFVVLELDMVLGAVVVLDVVLVVAVDFVLDNVVLVVLPSVLCVVVAVVCVVLVLGGPWRTSVMEKGSIPKKKKNKKFKKK